MDLSLLSQWLDVAEKIASGAVFVMGVVMYFMYKEREADKAYMRETELSNLKILAELTTMLKEGGSRNEERVQIILNSIKNATELIISHIKTKHE